MPVNIPVPTQPAPAEFSTVVLLRWLESHPLPPHLQSNNTDTERGIRDERAAGE
jgi:hypothetical protein